MLVFALCLLMKILEVSTGSTTEVDAADTGTGEGGGAPRKPGSNGRHGKKQRRRSRTPPPPIMRLIPSAAQEGACDTQTARPMPLGQTTAMTTEVMANRTESSECDWNRNVDPERLRRRGAGRIITELSNTMNKQDLITSHESVDGRWLTECGSCGIGTSCSCCRTSSRHQGMASTLSLGGPVALPGCLSASPLLSYDDMARHLDANLAQIDMEDFRTEDIHSLLALPTMCCADVQQTNRQGEMFASVSGSLMAKFDLESSISPRSSSQGEESGSTDMSICKSEPLFSPVKESPIPAAAANFSVDSLDCDLLAEQDIMLTCNKNNYTIAFEGSVTLCSEDSDYRETGDSESTSDNCSARLSALEDSCLVHSDSVYTTWSKLRRCSPRPPRCRCLMQRATRRPASTVASLLDNNNGDNSCTSSSNQSSSHNGNGTSSASSASSYSRSTSAAAPPPPSLAPATKSRSLPDLLPPPLAARAAAAPGSMTASALPGRCVRLYDVGVGDRLGGLVGLFVRGKGGSSRVWDSAHFEDSLVVRGQQIPEEPAASADSPPPDVVVSGGGVGDSSSYHKLPGGHARSPAAAGDDGKCRGTQTKTTADGELVDTSSSSSSTAASTPSEQKLSRPPRPRSSVSIVTTRSASTQMPVYVADVGLQTSGRSDSVPCAFHARLDRGASADDGSPTVRVCYPNYSLPDLSFLEERRQKGFDLNVLLAPQKFRTVPTAATAAADVGRRNRTRPLSCNDAEALRNRSFRHIRDWESLAVLLPTEYRRVLSEGIPPEGERSRGRTRTSECCDCSSTVTSATTTAVQQQQQSSSPSSSSGFRGSSTLLSESPRTQSVANPCLAAMVAPAPPRRSISLPAAEDGGVVGGVDAPPRPPLPRGILRRGQGGSLGELRGGGGVDDWLSAEKRRQWGDEDEEEEEVEDEGVDTGMESSGERAAEMRPPTPPVPRGGASEGVRRSRPWSLPPSGVGSRQWCDEGRGKRKSVSFAEDVWVQKGSLEEGRAHQRSLLVDLSGKRALAQAVVGAVELLCKNLGTGPRAATTMADLATKTLCPALHNLLADGLKGTIDTVFGPVNNSPWRIAEASGGSQHKDYMDLVMRLNSEERLKDGKMKFNAFIIGLLNTHALESWFLQLCKQDEVISKHYCPDGFMALAATATRGLTGHIGVALGSLSSLNLRLPLLYECGKQRRNDSDSQPLVPHPSPQQRPPVISGWAAPSLSQQGLGGYAHLGGGDSQRGRGDEDQADEDQAEEDEEEEEEDEGPLRLGRGLPCRSSAPTTHGRSLPRPHAPPRPPPRPTEHSPRAGTASMAKAQRGNSRSVENINSNANQASPRADGAKFRRLQMQWEMLAGREEAEEESGGAGGGGRSRIPRPVTSPVRPTPPSLVPASTSPSVLKYRRRSQTAPQTVAPSKGMIGQDNNLSGVDNTGGRVTVPSATNKASGVVKRVPPRPGCRVPRPASVSSGYGLQRSKKDGHPEGERRIVRALCSRDASAGGHLAFLEGDELSVALDVDSRWLLCTRGDRRGLVPKAAVTPAAMARVA